MKVEGYTFPHSSFLSTEKDMSIIVNNMLANDRLKKLLFYTTKDALSKPAVSAKDTIEMFGKNIKTIPKLYVDDSVLNYIIVSFDLFGPSENPEFRDNVVEFDIICHIDQWQLQDFALRPYKIAAELDTMFNKKHLTGIGLLEFLGANQFILNSEFAGMCLTYRAYHGEDDRKNALTGIEDQSLKDNYNKMYN